MKLNSIGTKVLALFAAGILLGAGGILVLLQYGFAQNAHALALEAVSGAQNLFQILETRETSKMAAVGDALMANPQVRDAFAAKDRNRLLAVTAPLYAQLKAEGITNWMFHTPEPQMSVFLRLHNPAKFGDQLGRFMDKEVVRTHAAVIGNELGKAGFAVRIIRPYYDAKGALIGYLEFGEEIGQFVRAMKSQTGGDYGLLLSKSFLDRRFWADSSAMWKRRDNWDDNASFVIADKTTANDDIIRFQEELKAVPPAGQVLERYKSESSVMVRGIFPIRDAAHNTVGAMFVVRDISTVYKMMRNTQTLLVVLSVVGMAIGAFLMVMLLSRLIFRRLDHIIGVATRLVGGDYETEVAISSDDEIGQFEHLFEQFRRVFVDLLSNLPEFQGKE